MAEGLGFVNRVCNMSIRPRMYVGRGVGEIASIAAAPVAAAVVDTALKEPYGHFKEGVARNWVLPNLEMVEGWLSHAKSLDPPHEREERAQLDDFGKARKITDLLVDQFGVKFGASLGAQFLTQDYFIRKFDAGVSRKHNVMSVALDRGVQFGSAIALNTVLADQAIAAQNGLIKIFKNAGMGEEKAEEWANYGVNFFVPNAAAYLVSAEFLTQIAKR